MIVVDLGNSDAKIGRFDGDALTGMVRVPTRSLRGLATPEDLLLATDGLKALLAGNPDVALGSVVSWAGAKLAALLTGTGCRVHPQTSLDDFGLRVEYEHGEPGVDRTAAASAAFRREGGPLILVGCGTALHTNVVTAEGVYLGGAIMPGLRLMTESLSAGADQLGRVDLVEPERAIGRSTPECVQIGIYHCWVGGALRLIEQTRREIGQDARLWLTGGQGRFLEPLLTDARVDADLALYGLRDALRRRLSTT